MLHRSTVVPSIVELSITMKHQSRMVSLEAESRLLRPWTILAVPGGLRPPAPISGMSAASWQPRGPGPGARAQKGPWALRDPCPGPVPWAPDPGETLESGSQRCAAQVATGVPRKRASRLDETLTLQKPVCSYALISYALLALLPLVLF